MEAFSHTIRAATVADAPALATLAETTFRETFGLVNTSEDMDVYCRRSYSEAIQASEITNKATITLVVDSQGCLVGYAQLRLAAPAPRCVPGMTRGEIHRIYVTGEYHGKGVAQALMDSSISALRQRGCSIAWLGVWEKNPRAISFYRKLGFVEVGEHVFQLGTDSQRDIVMLLPLDASGDIT
ncbi:GNAT family N-acetyltransferase [Denitratimonas sp. CY0512]|jgi:ribosomal protein S18 acetylase RimI-like enzyme|uniref:GNAT family N-acetyltransferase n=1 Tax=Denitratimonas sp. CY0512 TaxID=3131940 RepID=UPI0030A448E0